MFSERRLKTARNVFSTAASVAATAMLVRSIARDYLPDELREYLFSNIRSFYSRFSTQLTLVIDEFNGLIPNQIYESTEVYVSTIISSDTHRINVNKSEKEKNMTVTVEPNQELVDWFDGVQVKWVLLCKQTEIRGFKHHGYNNSFRTESRSFELSFNKKHKEKIISLYLPYIIERVKSMKQGIKILKIFTFDRERMYGNLANAWIPVNLDHPATFDTLAIEPELKRNIVQDLEQFVKRRDYYRKVGKAWKRGYLLYGPPGTGKSSLTAAIANHLKFDIYDLELTEIKSNSDLRKLLIATANRSILVVEDVDCTIELQNRMDPTTESGSKKPGNKVTLSGLLNFIDGLWSSCGDERIIIFTTNHRDKLDPALLRPGRMDFHIHLSYCTPCGFRILANNYIGITEHPLFQTIEEMIQVIEVTPAEVAEQLMKSDDPEDVLEGLVEFLEVKKKAKLEPKISKDEEECDGKTGDAAAENEGVKEYVAVEESGSEETESDETDC